MIYIFRLDVYLIITDPEDMNFPQVLQRGALLRLMKMVKSSSVEEGIKAMYAVSALIRNNLNGQELFFAGDGDTILQVNLIGNIRT